MFLKNVAHFDVSKTYKIFKKFYRLRNIFNCVLPHWRHLTAGLLYNDFGAKLAHVFRIVHLISVVKTRNMFIELALNLEKKPVVNIWMHDF